MVETQRIHFSGVAGAGMNPLARLLAGRGAQVSGSDRALDQGQCGAIAELLRAAGVALWPHDGSAIDESVARVIHSTAVETTTPELQRAQELQIPLQTRPALLAEVLAAGEPGVAISGTSGKSTIVGMIHWCLRYAACPATVLGGAALAEDGAQHMGCFAQAGAEAPVVAEACESDGTLVGYQPGIGLIHNLSRDHDELAALRQQFTIFAEHSELLLVNGDDAEALALAADHPRVVSYGRSAEHPWCLEVIRTGPWRGLAEVTTPDGEVVTIDLPQPGGYNLSNALAAMAVVYHLGVEPALAAAALNAFPGVARRFQVLGRSEQGITVIDDYAHNGAKIAAAIDAAQGGCDRLLAVFQPHGYGPARFLRGELATLLPTLLRPQDLFCYAEIFYAGGTVARDISAADLAADLPPGLHAAHAADHLGVLHWLCEHAMPGDSVLIMGARDPRLGELARCALDML